MEDPTDTGRCFCGVGVNDRAVCTSGDYLWYTVINGKSYGHILDPRTGFPVSNGCLS
ncbi:MAG: FAD:protein FMN transferase [bacterium]